MNQGHDDLLKALSSGMRSRGVSDATPRPSGSSAFKLEGASFQSLLEQARSGKVSSGRPVTIGRDSGVELTDQQLERVAAAVDLAEASGASRPLVVIDGKALKIDVGVRTITGVADVTVGKAVTGIDAIIHVPGVSTAPPEMVTPVNAATPHAGGALLKSLGSRASRATT